MKTRIIHKGVRPLHWIKTTFNEKPLLVAWDEAGQYVAMESFNALLPVPVDGLGKMARDLERHIKAVRRAFPGAES